MAKIICGACGTQDKSKTHTKGSLGMEILLWIMFIVPGILYSIWRLTTRKKVCSVCGADSLIPADTPRGKQLAKEFGGSI